MIVGRVTTEHLLKVYKVEVGAKTYVFPTPIELPAGRYEVHVKGKRVEFVKIADDLANLLERSEHA